MTPQIRITCNLLFGTILAALFSTSVAQAQRLVISAPSGHARLSEVVEIPLAEARQHIPDIDHKVAEDAQTHKKLATEIDSFPGTTAQLLVAVQIPVTGKLTLDFVPAGDTPQPPLVFGREATERKDDYAWENQYVTYRVYGPALEATGEITSGIDVWSKRVPNFVIDSFYKRDAEGQRTHNPKLSYHKDNGVGLDSYEVGKTRGCGGSAVLSDGKLWVSNNYTHLKQLSNGPVRFAFELSYAPWNANGIEVTETTRITLDAGTHLNRIDSTFSFSGAATIEAAAGLAIHPGADYQPINDGRILSVWDTPQDPTAGRIATGLIAAPGQLLSAAPTSPQVQLVMPVSAPPTASPAKLDKQAVLVFPVHSGQTFTYYAGAGWSKADMPTQQAWDTYLQQTETQLQHPLHHHWEGKR